MDATTSISAPRISWTEMLEALPVPAALYALDSGALVRANRALLALVDTAEAIASIDDLLAAAGGQAGSIGHAEAAPFGAHALVTVSLPDADLAGALHEAETRCRALSEQTLFGVLVLDGETIADVNPACAEALGYAAAELVGRVCIADLVSLQFLPALRARMARWLLGEDLERTLRLQAVRKDGRFVDLKLQGRPIESQGRPMLACVIADLTETARAARELQRLAFHDPLTDLPNRALFADRLTQAIRRARRHGDAFAVMLLDLDGFKAVNDELGHECGDLVLRTAAQRFGTCLRDSDTLARHGGDEFTLLLQGVVGREEIETVAARIVAAAAEPMTISGTPCRIGASIGIARYPEDGLSIDALLGCADAAMYAAKTAGKSRHAFFDAQSMAAQRHENLLIEWTAEYDVGVEAIDQEHRRLAAGANALASAIAAAEDETRLAAKVKELISMTAAHFRNEEGLMDAHGIPGTEIHREEHRRLLAMLGDLPPHMFADVPSRTLVAVKDWLLAHVRHSDQRLARQLNERGVR
jgi:diguanylate cyclase (GGDEF)-like protein/hemerythrin-like metal-binding protein/PAS domain S-box-containing protein